MDKPITHYTKSGRINIAYQVFGEGSRDRVYVPGWVSNIDLMWRNPQLSDFLTSLGKHVRVILFCDGCGKERKGHFIWSLRGWICLCSFCCYLPASHALTDHLWRICQTSICTRVSLVEFCRNFTGRYHYLLRLGEVPSAHYITANQ